MSVVHVWDDRRPKFLMFLLTQSYGNALKAHNCLLPLLISQELQHLENRSSASQGGVAWLVLPGTHRLLLFFQIFLKIRIK